MAVQTTGYRTSAPELQLNMEHPSDQFIRRYASEVFGDPAKAETWLRTDIPALHDSTPDSVLISGDMEGMRHILSILIQIDYGVVS